MVTSGVAVHDAHLFTQLVDEDADRVGLADDAGQLAHGLTHQAGLQAHMAVAHFALDLGPGHHGGNRVHHDGIDGTGAHQCFADLHGLLAGIRLADQQVVDVHAQCLGIGGVQCVLDVDEGHFAALLLGFGQDVQGQRGLTAGFRPVHLDDAAAGHTAHAQRQVQAQTAVEMASTCMAALSPSFMTAPLPNCFSIWASAVASAFFFASGSVFWVAGATVLLF